MFFNANPRQEEKIYGKCHKFLISFCLRTFKSFKNFLSIKSALGKRVFNILKKAKDAFYSV